MLFRSQILSTLEIGLPDGTTDVLARINDHISPRLYELLPWNWKPLPENF